MNWNWQIFWQQLDLAGQIYYGLFALAILGIIGYVFILLVMPAIKYSFCKKAPEVTGSPEFFNMAIFAVKKATEDQLRKILKDMDNTFGPMGSGGYSVHERSDGSFLFRELDLAPTRSWIVKVKGNQIWAPLELISAINYCLARGNLSGRWRYRSFQGVEAIRAAFELA